MLDLPSSGINIGNIRIVKESTTNPLLAPRGVCFAKNMLFVSDTGNNRVCIWKNYPVGETQKPDITLGVGGKNSTKNVTSSLHYPSGIWSDGNQLIVADAWNHRVLIWKTIPSEDSQPADIVIGQPDFESCLPNVKGLRSEPSSKTLYWPYGVFSNGKSLWIADTGNRRVLFFSEIPSKNFSSSDVVIGQNNFNDSDFDTSQAIWPYSVKINSNQQMLIPDTQSYRVLFWKNLNSMHADVLLGQSNFKEFGQNQFHMKPNEKTLNWCYDACFYKNGIFVCDTGNSRILWFKKIPSSNNPSADAVIGKKGFNLGSENADTLFGTESSLYWPFSIHIDNQTMFIADTGNHRIVIADILID